MDGFDSRWTFSQSADLRASVGRLQPLTMAVFDSYATLPLRDAQRLVERRALARPLELELGVTLMLES